jgi:hypothetical protein
LQGARLCKPDARRLQDETSVPARDRARPALLVELRQRRQNAKASESDTSPISRAAISARRSGGSRIALLKVPCAVPATSRAGHWGDGIGILAASGGIRGARVETLRFAVCRAPWRRL